MRDDYKRDAEQMWRACGGTSGDQMSISRAGFEQFLESTMNELWGRAKERVHRGTENYLQQLGYRLLRDERIEPEDLYLHTTECNTEQARFSYPELEAPAKQFADNVMERVG